MTGVDTRIPIAGVRSVAGDRHKKCSFIIIAVDDDKWKTAAILLLLLLPGVRIPELPGLLFSIEASDFGMNEAPCPHAAADPCENME
jgi:hypothetical protein